MKMYQWTTLINHIRGIGPARARELEAIGIKTVGDLLEYQPLHYIYPGISNANNVKEDYVIIRAKIVSISRLPTRAPIVEAMLRDDSGECMARWYNQQFVAQRLRPGMIATFWGKMSRGVLQQPKFTTAQPKWDDIIGGYYGVHNNTIRVALKEVLVHAELPPMVDGFDRTMVFDAFHFPGSKESQQQVLTRLKFDEALCHQFVISERHKERGQQQTQSIWLSEHYNDAILSHFSYRLTDEQNNAIGDILCDIQSPILMARLLHGEVGVGKTAVIFYVAMLAALNLKRTLILCPTTILAQQHFDTLRNMGWTDCDLCLSGDSFADTKIANIIIGTHAILNSNYLLQTVFLVIIDEFHKFGVEQRAQVTKYFPHLLLVSATPIPRTLSMTVFGDLDVSTIREQPTARGQMVTRWVLPDKREAMYEIVEEELIKGHQAYFVYPRINSGDEAVTSALKGFNDLYKRFGSKYRVAILTGKHENKTKEIQQFLNGQTDILVSTIIAEVGLDCPNATVMVIEGADRFGLSQLHQLRGRVCRTKDTAYCFLVAETANLDSITRLEVIERCNNGFEIAEHDLRLRGPGEMLGTMQHGIPEFKFLSLVDDYDIMVEAKNTVSNGLINDGVCEMARLKYGLKPGGLV